ncbi:MAG: CoA-binding protein [Halohasta sp.]
MPVTDDEELRDLLSMNRIAVVGCSSTPGKAAHDVPAYLQRQGYEIVPVNPFADEILGEEAVDSLSEVEGEIELVDVFRPSEEVAGIVESTLDRRSTEGDVEAIWLQLGITDPEATAEAEDAGLTVVADRCLKVEHQRLLG